MNYLQLLHDSWRLFRTTRLIFVFGFLFLLTTLPIPYFQFVDDNPVLACIFFPIAIASFYITTLSEGSLYFAIHQIYLGQNVTFSQAWSQGKSKLLRNLGLFVLSTPFLLIGAFFLRWLITIMPMSPLLWLIYPAAILFMSSYLAFGFCAIMIDDVKVLAAAWTSFLITINNYSRILVISGAIYLIRLLITALTVAVFLSGLFGVELPVPLTFDYPTYLNIIAIPAVAWINWSVNLFLLPLEAIMLTLAYLIFTKEISYPALVQRQTTA